MTAAFRKVRIFVASPGDVQAERDQLARVIDELNLTIGAIAPEKNVVLELVRWETHVAPGLGRDAQEVVNRQIGDYDIFIGILWKRMGSPTAVARSGTEEEFRQAYAKWERQKRLPVLFYFCQQPFPPPRTLEEVDQLRKVVEFRAELSHKGLIFDYPEHETLDDLVRPHLLMVLGRLLAEAGPVAAQAAAQLAPGHAAVGEQLAELGRQYDLLCESVESSAARTRALGGLAARMRTLALGAAPLLPELVASPSAGLRLAAITVLQQTPAPEYLGWLAGRFGAERPFVAYHAALAALAAVRALAARHGAQLRQLIAQGMAELERTHGAEEARTTNRYQVLAQARAELDGDGRPPRSRKAKARKRS